MFRIFADGQLLYNPPNENYIALTPQLTVEMGKAGSLQFGLLPSNKLYGQLNKLKTIVTVEYDDEEIFRGRVLSTERTFDNTINYYCEGELSFLVDTEQRQEAFSGRASALFSKIITNHNDRVDASKKFYVGQFTVPDRDVLISGVSDEIEDAETGKFDYEQIAINASESDWIKTLDAIEDWIIAYTGGYLRTRFANNKHYLDLVADYGTTATQEIEFGRNLLDLTEEISAEDLFTVLIPLGEKGLTIAEANGGSDELVDEEAVAKYGRIMKTHTFSSVTDPVTLLENGQRYLANEVNVPVTITVRAIDLHMVNPELQEIRLGDRVKVKSNPHSMIDYLTCTKIEYDLENAANNAYTFGNVKQTLTQRYRKNIKEKAAQAEKAAHKGGGSGGGIIDESIETAWVKYVRDGHLVDIGTFNTLANNIKATLGIKLDAEDAENPYLKLSNIIGTTTEQGRLISGQAAQIELLNSAKNEHESAINLWAANVQQLTDTELRHYAELKILANDHESRISLNAENVDINNNRYDALSGELKEERSARIKLNNRIEIVEGDISGIHTLIAENLTADTIMAWIARVDRVLVNSLGASNRVQAPIGRFDDLAKTNGKKYALEEYVDTAVDDMATMSWVLNQGYFNAIPDTINITNCNASGSIKMGGHVIATQSWVEGKGYLTAIPNSFSTNAIAVNTSLTVGGKSVATKDWVEGRGYITQSDVNSAIGSYATKSWVESQFNSIKSQFASASHTHTWSSITGKPTTFSPSSHNHAWGDITGKPGAFLPKSHRHNVKAMGTTYYTSYYGG